MRMGPAGSGRRVAVVHGDVDGMVCAAIVKRCLGGNLEVIFSGPRRIAHTLREIDGPGGELIVADIGINEGTCPGVILELSRLRGSGWILVWVDHHIPPGGCSEHLGSVADLVVIRRAPSAASLLPDVLGCAGEVDDLVRLAEDADTAAYSLREARLLRAVSGMGRLRFRAVDQLAEAGGIFGDLLDRAERGLAREEALIRKWAARASFRVTSAGRRYALVLLPRGGPGSLIALELRSTGVAFTLVVRGSGSFSLYSGGDREVDLRKVCRERGGGGHPYACGGPLRLGLIKRILFRLLGPWYVPSEVWDLVEEVEEAY